MVARYSMRCAPGEASGLDRTHRRLDPKGPSADEGEELTS